MDEHIDPYEADRGLQNDLRESETERYWDNEQNYE
jgi:hypothetical protein